MEAAQLHELWFGLQRAASESEAAVDEALTNGVGMSLSWFLALRWLNRTPSDPDPVAQSTLDAAVGLTASGTSRLLRRIEDAGLIVRRQSDADRRSVHIELTAAGTEALRRAIPYFTEGIRNSALRNLNDASGDGMLSALRRVVVDDSADTGKMAEELSLSGVHTWHTVDAIAAADAMTIREALDPLIFTEAARYPSDDVIADLRVVLTDMVRSIDSPDRFIEADARFHTRLADLCQNTLLRSLYQDLIQRLSSGLKYIESTERAESATYLQNRLRIHADLIEAVAHSDEAAIERLSDEHRMRRLSVAKSDGASADRRETA